MDTLPVIRVEMTGTITSFRYPHFTQGVQPTLEMPPPSTIYGHLCSAFGDYVPAEGLQFAYRFTHQGKFWDYKEHLHFGKSIKPNPFDRELLFEPRLTLYIYHSNSQHLEGLFDALLSPHYAVVLGRSQDLMTYKEVKPIELQRAEKGYFDHTLLPLSMAPRVQRGTIAVTMARYINPRRQTEWEQYALLQGTAIYPLPSSERISQSRFSDEDNESEPLQFEGDQIQLWVDPESPSDRKYPDRKRIVWFHSFVKNS